MFQRVFFLFKKGSFFKSYWPFFHLKEEPLFDSQKLDTIESLLPGQTKSFLIDFSQQEMGKKSLRKLDFPKVT